MKRSLFIALSLVTGAAGSAVHAQTARSASLTVPTGTDAVAVTPVDRAGNLGPTMSLSLAPAYVGIGHVDYSHRSVR